jgi:hypothetical protein
MRTGIDEEVGKRSKAGFGNLPEIVEKSQSVRQQMAGCKSPNLSAISKPVNFSQQPGLWERSQIDCKIIARDCQ